MSNQHQAANRGLLSTMPIVLIGSLTLATLNLTGAADAASAQPKRPDTHRSDASGLGNTIRAAIAQGSATRAGETASTTMVSTDGSIISVESVAVPSHYTVRHGDTVSGIAGHFRLSTASVLALNGLSWKSTIFPGQILKLTKAKAATPAPKPTKPAKPPVATTPPAATPPSSTPPASATSATKYVIKSGDTITSIAKKFGVTVAAVLSANGLTAKSIIYAGRTLVIPATAPATVTTSPTPPTTPPATGTQPSQVGSVITPLSPEMQANALTIIAVGKSESVPAFGIIVALAAAAQESGLRDLSGGDLDSVGLFQQRPSAGWGTKTQLENTTYASELFFGGPSNPNKGKTRGLLDIPGWQSMTVTQAAQAVQNSAQPNAYAKWEVSARAWYASLA